MAAKRRHKKELKPTTQGSSTKPKRGDRIHILAPPGEQIICMDRQSRAFREMIRGERILIHEPGPGELIAPVGIDLSNLSNLRIVDVERFPFSGLPVNIIVVDPSPVRPILMSGDIHAALVSRFFADIVLDVVEMLEVPDTLLTPENEQAYMQAHLSADIEHSPTCWVHGVGGSDREFLKAMLFMKEKNIAPDQVEELLNVARSGDERLFKDIALLLGCQTQDLQDLWLGTLKRLNINPQAPPEAPGEPGESRQ